jgi:transposase
VQYCKPWDCGVKKTLHAAEQDNEPARERRQAWWEQISGLDPACLVFVDESGATTNMTRGYGRALRGERVKEGTPAGRWQTLTLLGAMSSSGLIATMTIPAATDGDVFLAYVEQVLCPRLQPGQVVIMDNLAAHKVDGVQQLIAAAGATLVYLPPYSPDLNPIEQCWAKIKELLRSVKARTAPLLEYAIAEAMRCISGENAHAWFHHCGYGL